MRQVTPRFLAVCGVFLLAQGLLAQTPPLPTQPPEAQDPAERVLREVDARIHCPRLEGMKDVSFLWQLEGTGPFQALSNIWIKYAWKAPAKVRMEYVHADGTPLETFPEFAKTPQGEALFKHLERQLHGMAQTLVIGMPLQVIYKDYYKEVKTREVNHKVEYRLVLRPKAKKAFTRVEIRIRDGLPREFIKTDAKGRVMTSRFRFEKRGKKWLVTGMKVEQGGPLLMDESYHYVLKKGLLVLQEIERGVLRGEKRKVKVRLEDLRVNQGLKDSDFEQS